jgi:hypothetical protein
MRYVAFTDPSGGSADSFTLAIAHRDADSLILDVVREIRPPFSPESVVAEFSGVLKSYRITRVQGDNYAKLWPVEVFAKNGIRYEQNARPKSDLYQGLLPLLNSRRCELLDHPKLINQLVNLERRTSRGGRDSIDHPSNSHDDIANAVAGVLTSIAAPKPVARTFALNPYTGIVSCERDQTGRILCVFDQRGREMTNADRNGCIPGKGINPDLSLFNSQRNIDPWRQ